MTGIYLKCDGCGSTVGGEEASSTVYGLRWNESSLLREYATSIGWMCGSGFGVDIRNTDYCQNCKGIVSE